MKGLINRLHEILFGDYIFIYQMGKVGSSSLESSLEAIGVATIHCHSFGGIRNYKFDEDNLTIKRIIVKWLFKISFRLRRKKIKIITLMRDPVSRNLSTLFQGFYLMLYKDSIGDNRKEVSLEEMLKDYLKRYVNTNVPIDWFKDELMFFTGVDVMECDFDQMHGRGILKNKNIEVLFLTAEKMKGNTLFIADFLGHDEFEFLGRNRSNNKWYADLYSNFKTHYQLSQAKCNKLYDSSIVKLFYDDVDISNFKRKWCEGFDSSGSEK